MIACAQRIARAGPSNEAKKPSPAVSSSRPRKRASWRAHDGVVPLEQLAPAAVAELGRLCGRADDVGEEDGREHAVGLGGIPAAALADSGEEALDLVARAAPDRRERHVPLARQLDEARAGNLVGGVAGRPRSAGSSSVRWRTSVGTRIVGSTCADVDLAFICSSALIAPGLALSRGEALPR